MQANLTWPQARALTRTGAKVRRAGWSDEVIFRTAGGLYWRQSSAGTQVVTPDDYNIGDARALDWTDSAPNQAACVGIDPPAATGSDVTLTTLLQFRVSWNFNPPMYSGASVGPDIVTSAPQFCYLFSVGSRFGTGIDFVLMLNVDPLVGSHQNLIQPPYTMTVAGDLENAGVWFMDTSEEVVPYITTRQTVAVTSLILPHPSDAPLVIGQRNESYYVGGDAKSSLRNTPSYADVVITVAQ